MKLTTKKLKQMIREELALTEKLDGPDFPDRQGTPKELWDIVTRTDAITRSITIDPEIEKESNLELLQRTDEARQWLEHLIKVYEKLDRFILGISRKHSDILERDIKNLRRLITQFEQKYGILHPTERDGTWEIPDLPPRRRGWFG